MVEYRPEKEEYESAQDKSFEDFDSESQSRYEDEIKRQDKLNYWKRVLRANLNQSHLSEQAS